MTGSRINTHRKSPSLSFPPSPIASVIITAHNAEATIERCLLSIQKSISNQGIPIEIILVDDRSTDNTSAVAIGLGIEPLNVIRLDEYTDNSLTSRQVALHQGISAAQGDIILLTNADSIVPISWIKEMITPFNSKGIAAAAGLVRFDGGDKAVQALQNIDITYYSSISSTLNSVGISSGILFGNFAFRKSVYFSLGGFSSIGFSLTEDLSFGLLLHRKKLLISYPRAVPVKVRACNSWKELIERTYRVSWGRFSVFSFLIVGWLLLLPLFAGLSIAGIKAFLPVFLARILVGGIFVSNALLRSSNRKLTPFAWIYEWIVIFFGMMIMVKKALRHKVQWGGVLYER